MSSTTRSAALLDYPPSRGGVSLLGVPRMFTDREYRERVVREIQDPRTRAFWTQEFESYPERFAAEVVSPIQNKVGALLAAPAVRNMLGQATSTLRIAEAMDNRRIVICNLSKGRLGEAAANLVGSLLVTAVQLAAMRRTAEEEEWFLLPCSAGGGGWSGIRGRGRVRSEGAGGGVLYFGGGPAGLVLFLLLGSASKGCLPARCGAGGRGERGEGERRNAERGGGRQSVPDG